MPTKRVFKYTGFDKTNSHLKTEAVVVTPAWGRFKYGIVYNWYSLYSK